MTADSELLRIYAATGSEEAFAKLVRRHLNLVYSAAMRQVNGDTHLAQDVVQSVFTDLARKASSLTQRELLSGWLYTSAHFAAAKAVRAARRRYTHEQEAHAMQELLQNPAPNVEWESLRPILDEVMHELNEPDRDALLMRFFENRPLAEIGQRLGLSEDAARKRVDRALEKLRAFLSKRGITTAATLASVLSANAVQIAPTGLAGTVVGASLAGAAAGTGTTFTLLKLITMSKLQIGLVGALAGVALAAPVVIQKQNRIHSLIAENVSLRQQASRADETGAENDRLSKLEATADPLTRHNDEHQELLRLRAEVTRLQQDSQALAQLKADPSGVKERIAKIRARLEQMPEKKIPELQFLTEQEWGMARLGKAETDEDYRAAFSMLREKAKDLFARWVGQALHNYAKANGGFLPTDLAQLKPYFTPPVHDPGWKPGDPPHYQLLEVDDAVLQRYQLVQTGKLSDVPQVGTYPPKVSTGDPENDAFAARQREKIKTNLPWTEPVIVEKAPVDEKFDSMFTITVYGYSYRQFGRGNGSGSGTFAKAELGPDGAPVLVDPVSAVGRVWTGGGSFGGGTGGGSSGPVEGSAGRNGI